MAKTRLTKDGETIYVDSTALASHLALGWKSIPAATIDAGELKLDGVSVDVGAAELNALDNPDVDAGTLENLHYRHYQLTPDAAGAAAIHAEIPLTDAAQTITTGITQPDVPRVLTIKGNASGIAGNVVITGTNIDDEAITETIALNGATEVTGTKAFKTIESIVLPAETHAPDVKQVETATVVGTISGSGNAAVVVTAAGMTGSPKTVNVAVSQGVKQAETATAAGTITTDGDAEVTVTADGMTNSPKAVAVAVQSGVAQVETATVVGTITGAGYANVIVTAAGMTGSPVTCKVYVDVDDTASIVATKIRAELNTHSEITDLFTISGADAAVILTAKSKAANDATLNIDIDNDTCTGLTDAPTSANTAAGVAPDGASDIAGKIRTALGLDADVSAFFTISGSGTSVVLTAKAEAANDATMNIAIDNDTCVGITPAATSANTTAGVAADTASDVGGKIRTALAADATIAAFFTVSGSGANVVLTAKAEAANDGTMNISIDNGTCTGLTPATTSANTNAGVYDTISIGQGNSFGLPHIVYNAALMLVKLFDGSADSGSLAVDDNEIEKNLYAINGTPDGIKVLDLYYLV